MNLIALFLCAVIGRRQPKGKLLLISLAAGLFQTLGVILIHPFRVYEIVCYVLICPLMSCLATWPECKKSVLRDTGIMYCIFFLMGGIMEWMNRFNPSYGTFMLTALCACVVLTMLFEHLTKSFQAKKQIYPVLLVYHKSGVRLKAYYDTGNNLREPFYQRPVHITDRESIQKILDVYDRPYAKVPFHTISGSDMIDTIVADRMMVDLGEKIVEVKEPVIGLKEHMQLQQKCKMLLNAEVLNEKT